MKVALAYDRINKWGGAERVLLALHELFPEAPLYTAVYSPKTAPWAEVFPKVIPSFLRNFPFAMRHELYASLMPLAFESFNFDEYDLVISVTSEAAKGIITKPKTLHICYCLTPTRYLWSHYNLYFQNPILRFITKPIVAYLRFWDKIAAQRPDYYLAISKEVQKRIRDYYNRDSIVVYPLVTLGAEVAHENLQSDLSVGDSSSLASELPSSAGSNIHSSRSSKSPPSNSSKTSENFVASPHQDANNYFLIVSRLVPYKRIDIAIEAFNQLNWPLKIVGVGSEGKRLRKMARANIDFLGNLTDGELLRYYRDCRALIFPGMEDLGLTILEAQSFGKPVIAFRGGGALETIVEGKTGDFFYPQTPEALIKALKRFDLLKFNPNYCMQKVKKFNKERFRNEFKHFVEQKLQEHFKCL